MKKVKVTTCTSIYRYTEYEIELPNDFPEVNSSTEWRITQEDTQVLWDAINNTLGKITDEDVQEEWIID